MKYTCPGCGFIVFNEPPGSYDICTICGWEDDPVQLRYPAMSMGANHKSLYEWQQKVDQWISDNIVDFRGYRRDPLWRPIRIEEYTQDEDAPKTGLEYFTAAAVDDIPRYYWQMPSEEKGDSSANGS